MAFISEALPGVVFLVRLWICKFSFQGSPAAHDLHLEQLGGLGLQAEAATAKRRWRQTCLPRPPGPCALTEDAQRPWRPKHTRFHFRV